MSTGVTSFEGDVRSRKRTRSVGDSGGAAETIVLDKDSIETGANTIAGKRRRADDVEIARGGSGGGERKPEEEEKRQTRKKNSAAERKAKDDEKRLRRLRRCEFPHLWPPTHDAYLQWNAMFDSELAVFFANASPGLARHVREYAAGLPTNRLWQEPAAAVPPPTPPSSPSVVVAAAASTPNVGVVSQIWDGSDAVPSSPAATNSNSSTTTIAAAAVAEPEQIALFFYADHDIAPFVKFVDTIVCDGDVKPLGALLLEPVLTAEFVAANAKKLRGATRETLLQLGFVAAVQHKVVLDRLLATHADRVHRLRDRWIGASDIVVRVVLGGRRFLLGQMFGRDAYRRATDYYCTETEDPGLQCTHSVVVGYASVARDARYDTPQKCDSIRAKSRIVAGEAHVADYYDELLHYLRLGDTPSARFYYGLSYDDALLDFGRTAHGHDDDEGHGGEDGGDDDVHDADAEGDDADGEGDDAEKSDEGDDDDDAETTRVSTISTAHTAPFTNL